MFVALALLLVGQISPAPPPSQPCVMQAPDWIRKPTVTEFSRYYPERAARKNQSGRVMLRCEVKADGFLENCAVASETPADFGFGQAALKIAAFFQMRPTAECGASLTRPPVMIPLSFG